MKDRFAPPATDRRTAPPANAGRPLAGAVAASLLLHGAALAALVAALARTPGAPVRDVRVGHVAAVLLGQPAPPDRAVSDTPARLDAPSPAAEQPLAPAPATTSARGPSPAAPWTSVDIDTSPPEGFFARAATPDGVEALETRDLVRLGEAIERRVRAEYPDEPDQPVALHPPGVLGYPLDLVAAGVEGTVLVWFAVNEYGDVEQAIPIDGPLDLMAWVEGRIGMLVRQPALRATRPVRSWVALELTFSREGARAKQAAGAPR